jgi:hypothetical protein
MGMVFVFVPLQLGHLLRSQDHFAEPFFGFGRRGFALKDRLRDHNRVEIPDDVPPLPPPVFSAAIARPDKELPCHPMAWVGQFLFDGDGLFRSNLFALPPVRQLAVLRPEWGCDE